MRSSESREMPLCPEAPRINSGWQEIFTADPDHEKHLGTAEGRFQAILDLVKNGGMVLEIMMMDRTWQNFRGIAGAVNSAYGERLVQSGVARNHLAQTVSNVGAAARSDINDEDWQLTPFGMEAKAALVYTWQKFLQLVLSR